MRHDRAEKTWDPNADKAGRSSFKYFSRRSGGGLQTTEDLERLGGSGRREMKAPDHYEDGSFRQLKASGTRCQCVYQCRAGKWEHREHREQREERIRWQEEKGPKINKNKQTINKTRSGAKV